MNIRDITNAMLEGREIVIPAHLLSGDDPKDVVTVPQMVELENGAFTGWNVSTQAGSMLFVSTCSMGTVIDITVARRGRCTI
jgi:hypothetical protein